MSALTRPLSTLVLLGVLAGCGGQATSPRAAAPAGPAATAVPTCRANQLPTGFVVDPAHSGPLTPGLYSSSQDVQAALVYDKLQRGERTVFTRLKAAPGADLVIECTVLDFDTPADARRFALAFEDLRRQAGSLVSELAPAPIVPGSSRTVGYREQQQAFEGYGIASTQVIESAALTGTRFASVSVAGPAPDPATAEKLLPGLAAA